MGVMERVSESVAGLSMNEAFRERDGGVNAAVAANWICVCVCVHAVYVFIC